MTAVAYVSGWCGYSGAHGRCPVAAGRAVCSCDCHAEPSPPVVTGGRRLAVPLLPGTPEWLRTMSASKIAAVVGLSPYQSRYSLWHLMAGHLDPEPRNPQTDRGHYLEAGVAAWFADQHPDWQIRPSTGWQYAADERFTAAPDREIELPDGEIRGLEIKTAANDDEWGAPGTAEIPAGYLAQTQWQMLCAGYRVTHVAVLSSYLDLREYIVGADDEDAAYLREQAAAFLASLPDGACPEPPDIDAHDATYRAVRRMHPGLDMDLDVEVSAGIAARYPAAVTAAKAADAELQESKARLLDEMGDARRAKHLGAPIARRQRHYGGISLYPTFPETRQPE